MGTRSHQPCRILIVEDELIVAADLDHSLCELGFEVVATVRDAAQAIEVASRERPDLILMDIQLHGETGGIHAADTIRRQWNIPVVFLTAYTTDDIMERARAAGAYGFLSKPFRIEDLNATILIALQQHRLGQQLFAEHNWLATMLASLSDGVIAADTGGCVRYMNPAAERLTGWSAAEAHAKTLEEVYRVTYMDGTTVAHCQLRRALSSQNPVPKERFLLEIKNGGKVPVEDAAAPIIEDGHLIGAVTIFLDISARVLAEEQQQIEHGRLRQEVQVKSEALGHTQDELRALSGRLITAQEDERRRVARELHDDLGQRAALMGWRVAELTRTSEALPEKMQEEIQRLQHDLDHLSSVLRDVSHRLHPAIIADLGLATALRGLIDQQRQQGFDVTFIERNIPSAIPPDIGTALYRIAQEALRNAFQHAPDAPVLATLSFENSELQLQIEDPGPGFDLEGVRQTGGLGLLSIQERARLLGGTLEIKTAQDEGTVVTVRIPMPARRGTQQKMDDGVTLS